MQPIISKRMGLYQKMLQLPCRIKITPSDQRVKESFQRAYDLNVKNPDRIGCPRPSFWAVLGAADAARPPPRNGLL